MIHVAKVHDVLDDDSLRQGRIVLVDRLWPRGVAKADLGDFEWLKDVAPSPELRKWFDHDPERFDEFAGKYRAELDEADGDVDTLLSLAGEGDVTLLYAAKDREINHAVVLQSWLQTQIGKQRS